MFPILDFKSKFYYIFFNLRLLKKKQYPPLPPQKVHSLEVFRQKTVIWKNGFVFLKLMESENFFEMKLLGYKHTKNTSINSDLTKHTSSHIPKSKKKTSLIHKNARTARYNHATEFFFKIRCTYLINLTLHNIKFLKWRLSHGFWSSWIFFLIGR